jgi:hypothetical protein
MATPKPPDNFSIEKVYEHLNDLLLPTTRENAIHELR